MSCMSIIICIPLGSDAWNPFSDASVLVGRHHAAGAEVRIRSGAWVVRLLNVGHLEVPREGDVSLVLPF